MLEIFFNLGCSFSLKNDFSIIFMFFFNNDFSGRQKNPETTAKIGQDDQNVIVNIRSLPTISEVIFLDRNKYYLCHYNTCKMLPKQYMRPGILEWTK